MKIGFSTNPTYREKTLQSEEPEVFFERTYEGTRAQEQGLHLRFASKRVRGEWFELFDEDISEIDEMLDPSGDAEAKREVIELFTKLIHSTEPEHLGATMDHINGLLSRKEPPFAVIGCDDAHILDEARSIAHDLFDASIPITDEMAIGAFKRMFRKCPAAL